MTRLRALVGLTLLSVTCLTNTAWPAPRLLDSFPKDNTVYNPDVTRLMLVFSEPIDPSSIVLPNLDSNNSNRSFDVKGDTLYGVPVGGVLGTPATVPVKAKQPVTHEGGRLIEVPGFMADSLYGGALHLHIYRNGFRSLKGEPLDHDYDIEYGFYIGGGSSYGDWFQVSLPPNGQANADPVAPFSLYFGAPIDAASFQAEVRAGDEGPALAPVAFHWDMPLGSGTSQGFTHLTVDHPPLPPSPMPYVLYIDHALLLGFYRTNPDVAGTRFRFTVGPALAGDLNGDSQVTVGDAVLALRAALGLLTLTDAQTFAADLVPRNGANGRAIGDGREDVADAAYILQRAIGLAPDYLWP